MLEENRCFKLLLIQIGTISSLIDRLPDIFKELGANIPDEALTEFIDSMKETNRAVYAVDF